MRGEKEERGEEEEEKRIFKCINRISYIKYS
jgi:hypothetical protein